MNISFFKKQIGQSLVEILLVIGLSAIIIPALLIGLVATTGGKAQSSQRAQAVALLKETEEVVRSVREKSWNGFATNGTFYPVISGNAWSLNSGSETTPNGFTRSLTISDVYRDNNGVIVTSGGSLDPSTKKVVLNVNWGLPYLSSATSTMYVTRYNANTTSQQTTKVDFDSGSLTNVQTTNTSGGEIILATNTKGKWCDPHLSSLTIDLPVQPNAVYATEGNIYASSTNSSASFMHVLVGNGEPPTFTLNGRLTGYNARDVFGDSDWGYLATTSDSKEIVIIDLHEYSNVPNKIYQEEGSFNTPSTSTNADTVFVFGNRGYMTAGQYLYVFDLSSKSGSRPQVGSRIQFADTDSSQDRAGGLFVRQVGSDTYAYISVEGEHTDELEIANVTDPNNSSKWTLLTRTGSDESDGKLNIEPNNCSTLESGKEIFVKPDGSRVYISSTNDASFKEFFVIDSSNKSNPSLVGGFATQPSCTNGGGYEANGMNPEESVVVSVLENRAVVVGTGAEEYQVLDLSSEASPSRCGGLQLDQGIYGVAAVKETDGDAYAYLITGDSGNDLKLVQGGPDGNYMDAGVYTSAIMDFGSEVAMNRITATAATPASTNVQYQVAGADPVNGSCTNAVYTYVGPDGTTSSYFPANGGTIPLSTDGTGFENPARCVRFKAYLSTTDYNATPTIYDVVINYSQ